MSWNNEFGIIQVENIWEVSYKYLGVYDLIYECLKINMNLIQSKYICNIIIKKTPLTEIYIIFTDPSAWAGYDTRSIFKRSLTGLNSEFSFF